MRPRDAERAAKLRSELGDDDALALLIRYNLEDVVNLEPLAAFAYTELRTLCLDLGFVTADRLLAGSHQDRRGLRRAPVLREGARSSQADPSVAESGSGLSGAGS